MTTNSGKVSVFSKVHSENTWFDRVIGFFPNFEEIINSHALCIFLEHVKIWEVCQFLKM